MNEYTFTVLISDAHIHYCMNEQAFIYIIVWMNTNLVLISDAHDQIPKYTFLDTWYYAQR